ncbi:MAG: hypothetical protein RIT07_1417 [Bacteroidota bacterium]
MQKNTIFTNCLLCFSAIITLFVGCTSEKQTKLPVQDLTAAIERTGESGLTADDVKTIKQQFTKKFDRWCVDIMGIPPAYMENDSVLAVFLSRFYALNKPIMVTVKKHYARYPGLNADIEKCIMALKKHFPDAGEFEVFVYFSQFSMTNTFTDTVSGKHVLGYSAEMFLDDTCSIYNQIEGMPAWMKRYARTEQIAPYLGITYLNGRYLERHPRKNMLDEMIYQGKLWYSLLQLAPDMPPARLLGYTPDEWEFLQKEESNIWNFYIQEKMLFSTDFNRGYKRFFIQGERTTGAGLPEDCPPRIGNFSGLKIVSAYAEKTGKSLKQIWEEYNAGNILKESGYNPIR